MRTANWNIEWMNNWFVPIRDGSPTWRNGFPGTDGTVDDVRELAERVAAVIRRMVPDLIAAQEGPSRASEMQLFIDEHLDGAFDIFGPVGRGSQRMYVLVRTDGPIESTVRLWPTPGGIDFDLSWPIDVVGDLIVEPYEFTRAPLAISVTAGSRDHIVVNMHTKSKYIHGGRSLWENEATRPQFIAQRHLLYVAATRAREWLWVSGVDPRSSTKFPRNEADLHGVILSDQWVRFA